MGSGPGLCNATVAVLINVAVVSSTREVVCRNFNHNHELCTCSIGQGA